MTTSVTAADIEVEQMGGRKKNGRLKPERRYNVTNARQTNVISRQL